MCYIKYFNSKEFNNINILFFNISKQFSIIQSIILKNLSLNINKIKLKIK